MSTQDVASPRMSLIQGFESTWMRFPATKWITQSYVCMCIYIYAYAYAYVYMHTCIYCINMQYIYIHMYMHTHTHVRIYTYIHDYPKKWPGGGWASPFCRAKSDFWRPRPLQNEEPAKNVARCFLYKIRAPNPVLFWCTFSDYNNHWPLQSGEPGMSTHISRMATWKKASPQKYKGPFCRGVMWKNLGLPVSPENPEMYKNIFCRGNSCSTFPVLAKSI